MFDLKLDTLEESNIQFNEDPIEAFTDFMIAQEELHQAEQELFEINRAYENLTALQEVVAKHGWNDVLNDLVGNQISSESLDASCEGALDKIKGAIKNVGKAVGGWMAQSMNILNLYKKKFDSYAKQIEQALKSGNYNKVNAGLHDSKGKAIANRVDEKLKSGDYNEVDIGLHSSEALGFEAGKVYDIEGLSKAYLHVNDHIGLNETIANASYALKGKGLHTYIENNVKSVNYSSMSLSELLKHVKSAQKNLPHAIKSMAMRSTTSNTYKSYRKNANENAEMWKKEKENAKDIKSAAHAEDMEKTHRSNAHIHYGERMAQVAYKQILHLIIMSCKALDAELKKRGFKSDF